jgi:predicted ATPase/DNA-binding XRE family transcriptional regulator
VSSEQTSFGTLLRRYRTAAGFTQEALAARAQISARTIADLERGINRTPRHDTFELLLSALDLTAQQRALFLAMVRPEMKATAVETLSLSRFPLPPTSLIGRAQEMTRALTQLRSDEVRLLTLTGPAGIGKTRLGLQIASGMCEHFAGGVVFVPLATLRNAALLPGVIAHALGIRESLEGELSEQVITFLQEKVFLLILDNFEQILEAASYVAHLLSICPHLSILVTSRMPLRLRAEQVMPLAPLPLADAVTLFRERALAIRPGGVYAPHEVAAICERLDRLPLAIELAAMHVRTLSLPDLYTRLTHRLAVLRDGARDLPARQQTMEEAIAWSYDLLTGTQQQCFRALGGFVGGWTLEAAEAVCRAEKEKSAEEIILTLAALVDASLVQVDIPVDGPARFGMFELIREFALQRLRASGEEEPCRRRHAVYYAQLAERAWSELPGQRAQEAFLLQDIPNVRAAIQWAEEQREVALGLQLARFSWGGWFSQGQISEGEGLLERMLALSWQSGKQEEVPFGPRAVALYGFGQSLLRRGKTERAEAIAREALERAQRSGDHCGICSALAILGQIAQRSGNLDEAAIFLVESDEHARLGGFPDLRGFTSRNLAELARMQGDLVRATTLYEEALAVARATGMTFGVAMIMTMLGHLARQQQNYAQAKVRYREGLTLLSAFDSPTYTAWCLEGYAAALSAEEHYVQVTRLCAAAVTLREQVQTPLPPAERQAFEQVVAVAKAALDERAFEEEWTRGAGLTNNQAIDYALSDVRDVSA